MYTEITLKKQTEAYDSWCSLVFSKLLPTPSAIPKMMGMGFWSSSLPPALNDLPHAFTGNILGHDGGEIISINTKRNTERGGGKSSTNLPEIGNA